jgi:hypothetical protein
MNSELLTRLKELANSDDVLSAKKDFFEIKSQLQNLLDHRITSASSDEEKDESNSGGDEKSDADAVAESVAAETKPKAENEESPADTAEDVADEEKEEQREAAGKDDPELAAVQKELDDLTANFKAKLKQLQEEKAKLEKATVDEAKKLLAEMKELVAEEENIGKAFARFNEIMEHWKSLPKVSNDDYRDLNADYNKYVEQFFYNINIYKELKELDLKHNLDEKMAVLESQKKLLDENDIRLLEVEVRMNQDRWNEIGPTFKEEWDKIKSEFWDTTRAIYGKIQEFYDSRREEQSKNLEAKKQLLEKVKYISSLELKSPKKWQDKTNEVIQIQKEWKMVGFVPKGQSGDIWKEFKSVCDAFFERKRAHFDELRKVQNENKAEKVALLEKAKALKDSEDWKNTSQELIQIQKQWKQIGPAHQRDENKLWRQFREACDEFFQRRNAHRSGRGDREKENLEQKEALLKEIESWSPEKGKREENLAALKEFGNRYREIGFVPFKDKDRIAKSFSSLMDEKYGELNIDTQEIKKIQLREKIEDLKTSDQSDRLIRKEQDHIRNKISKIQSEVNQLENNLGFFADSKGADKLKQDVEKKIEKAEKEIAELKEQLALLRNA